MTTEIHTKTKIVDLPSLGVQLHIHEDANGNIFSAHQKLYSGERGDEIPLNEAAILDSVADNMGLKKYYSK